MHVGGELIGRINNLEQQLSEMDLKLQTLQNTVQYDVEDVLNFKKYLSAPVIKFLASKGKPTPETKQKKTAKKR